MAYGLTVLNESGIEVFSTESKLFLYRGYWEVGLGAFDLTIDKSVSGKAVFIPVIIKSSAPKATYGWALTNYVYLTDVVINGYNIKGNVKSVGSVSSSEKYFRIYYGVY